MNDIPTLPEMEDSWGDLWSIFAEEGKESLDRVEETLLALETHPEDGETVATLFRAMHTFKGNARLMGLSTIEGLAHHAEDLIGLVRDEGVQFSSSIADLLLRVLDQLRALLVETIRLHSDISSDETTQAQIDDLRELYAYLREHPAAEETALPSGSEDTDPPIPEDIKAYATKEVATEDIATEDIATVIEPVEEMPQLDAVQDEMDLSAPIDPRTDALYVRIFLEVTKDELPRLCAALDSLDQGNSDAEEQLTAAVDTLRHAATQMGYADIICALDALPDGGKETEQTLLLSLKQIQDEYQLLAPGADAAAMDLLYPLQARLLPPVEGIEPLDMSSPSLVAEPQTALPDVETKLKTNGDRSLADFTQTIGEMLAAQATLHRVVERLTEIDVIHLVDRSMKQNGGDWGTARKDVQNALKSWSDDLWTLTQLETELAATLDRLQENALSLRVEPANSILAPLIPLVNGIAQRRRTVIDLVIEGADMELDRPLLQRLAQPVRQLVRFMAQKSIADSGGVLRVTVDKREDRVRLIFEDNGHGLDEAAILDDGNLDLSSIREALAAERGALTVENYTGQGMCFVLEMPIDMAVIDGMVVRSGGVHYIAPIGIVRRIVRPSEQEIVSSSVEGGRSLLRLGEQYAPIEHLAGDTARGNLRDRIMLVVDKEEQPVALVVDELLGQQQVLIRPLQGHLAGIPGVSGCALLGDGDVGMVMHFN